MSTKESMSTARLSSVSASSRAKAIADADKNGDGALQIDEFQTVWLNLMRHRMVDHFQFLDDDGNGKVTDAEISKPLDRMTRFMDRDDDGTIERGEMGRRHGGGYHDGEHRGHGMHRDDDDKKSNN
ncbi:MAG: hypothetical protein VW405_22850 [Rhodospirillaceae bacterium]